jgi:hypothetical protein
VEIEAYVLALSCILFHLNLHTFTSLLSTELSKCLRYQGYNLNTNAEYPYERSWFYSFRTANFWNTTLQTTYLFTHGAEPFMRSRQMCSHLRTSQHFMESEGSLSCL